MRRIAMAIGAIFIGLIFLSSYFTLHNLSTGSSGAATNKTITPQTLFGVATANAVFSGYNNTLNIAVSCSNSTSTAVNTKISQFISAMENNNSVYNSYSLPNETTVQPGTMSIPALYRFFSNNLNKTEFSCLTFSSEANITLPQELNIFIVNKSYTIAVPQGFRQAQVPLTLGNSTPSTVRVRVSALVTTNGTIYSMSVSKLP
jgi:hypothetical protein